MFMIRLILQHTHTNERKSSFLIFLFTLLISSLSFGQGTIVFDTPGSGTWVVPCGVTEIEVQVWGAGGAGGGSTGNNRSGGGGGSGCYGFYTITVTAGHVFNYIVGAGGTGVVGDDGLNGESSEFGANTVGGGFGGIKDDFTSGNGCNTGPVDGNDGIDGTGDNGGNGGDAPNGGAGGIGTTTITGGDGASPGGGGGGSYGKSGNTDGTGGAGGDGQIIIFYNAPFPAGSGQALAACETDATLNADALPAGYQGTWSVSPAGPVITDDNDPNSTVTDLGLNEAYTFTWTVTAGGCAPVTDEVNIVTQSMEVDAGFDQNFCQTEFTMDANTPSVGSGEWSIVSGSAGITNYTDPNTTITGLAEGDCVTLEWTITNGACVGTDQVTICRPDAGESCNDGPCAAISVSTDCASPTSGAFAGATATQNPGQPGCGSYDFYGGDKIDVWFEATSDADGNLNLELSGTIYLNAALYTGNCTDLNQFSCHGFNNADPLIIQETGLPPNETIYVRVWRRINDATATFDICQTESQNEGDIMPGETTIACGSTYDFYDSGGDDGNYGNNELTTWLICPDQPGEYVTIDFSMVDIEAGSLDQLIIIDGDDASDPVFNPVPNTTSGVSYTSSHESGCLLISFRSDYTITRQGWEAIVSCTTDEVNNTSQYAACTEQNCIGGCMRTLCGIGSVEFTGDGFGIQELNFGNNGCMDTGERCANWFFINPQSAGYLTMDMYVNNGQNQDFAIWEGYPPSLACPSITEENPIMCNIGPATNLGTGFNSEYSSFNTAYEDNLIVTQQQIDDGVYFIMMVQTFSNGNSCPQPTVDITFGGTVDLSCDNPIEPPSTLDVSLLEFNALNKGNANYVYWTTSAERDNDFFTLEYSSDGKRWETISIMNGAGNSTDINGYSFNHIGYENAINYYRLTQTDYDGTSETFDIVSVDNRSDKKVVKVYNLLGQEINLETYKGVVIFQYDDGTTQKKYLHNH